MGLKKAMAFIIMQMEINMMEDGKMIKRMDMGFIIILSMEKSMKDNE